MQLRIATELVGKFAEAHVVTVMIDGQLEINVDAVLVVVYQIYVIVIPNIRLVVVVDAVGVVDAAGVVGLDVVGSEVSFRDHVCLPFLLQVENLKHCHMGSYFVK